MLFNSFSYALFFPLIFFLYWFVTKRSLKVQNIMLLLASYFFYGCWDWRFVFLLAFSTALDYGSGIMIQRSESNAVRKAWLIISVGLNLSFLGFFKYYNFFIESFADLLRSMGMSPHYSTLNIILPIGISFYTFHGLSYVFDIYNRRIQPTYNLVNYTLFVSFFPLLVAGPIERATHLLPQIEKPRVFRYEKAVDGLRQMLWGLFKKIVIADNCAYFANEIFNNSAEQSGSTLVLGAIFFTFQIYGDFSGYSDIALGSARLLGFELLKNFNFPYFSRDIAEFWRRWHISLSTWFKDYLYIPLGGSKGGNWMRIRNTFIIFLVSGFWHGANWTFLFWGGLNALFIMPSIIMKTNRNNIDIVAQGRLFPNIREVFQLTTTFALAVFAWIFFRAESLSHAFDYIGGIFSSSLFTVPTIKPYLLFALIAFFMVIEWLGRENNYALERFGIKLPAVVRWAFYFVLIGLIFIFFGSEQEFIYFQF
ncbi:membrane-bound O-acyltransferase family protein [Flavobacterium album]|uniref:Membrane-bound O-acyltransferase family protein n=1 Tax=Flavobacterium album TaxID=2175091 RepID=A0A2S1QTS9_9FLAO|nr:MBOAT family O-acyltransferase [Flavobacterium album]AWH83776.1 membrane-bound O-acyltransferase family protein [Flavobacterium album]